MKNRNLDASMSSMASGSTQQNCVVKREHSDDYYVSTLLKLKGGVVIRQHSDDDDYVPPLNGGKRQKLMECNIVEKERKKVLVGKKKKKTLESIKTRQCPGPLVSLFKKLSDAQKKDVIDMGFEAIFDLKVSVIPGKLSYFVCDNFDTVTNTLIIGNKSVEITKQSVHDILGFPIGQNKVNAVTRAGKGDDGITNEWRKQYPVFKKGTQRIYVSDVVNKIANNKRGGKMFKMNMLVLMMTSLAEGIKCGTVNQKILPCIENVEEIANMDWCGYIFECLRRSKIGWRKDGNKSCYTGPLLFLTLFYVDAIRTMGQNMLEVRPAIKYVTNKMLKDLEQNGIQAGGFENFSFAHPIQAVQEWDSQETEMEYINDEGDKGGEEEDDYIQGEDEVEVKDNERDEGQDVDMNNEENDAFESKEDEVENGIVVNQGSDDVYPYDTQLLIDTISTQPDTNDDIQKNNIIADQLVQALQRKISSPESSITCVHGYKVKNNIAPILEAIFKKHGDIAVKCVFKTASVKTSFLETVCEVVRRILTNDVIEMEEIENEVSDAEAANIDVSWLRAHMVNFPKRKDDKMLMDTKENITLVNREAQMDLQEKHVEFLAARQRFQKAKTYAKVLDLVEKKVNNDILENKAEKDSWVSCFGDDGNSDTGDYWRLEIEGSGKNWRQDQRIRLRHVDTSGYLHSHNKKYSRIAGGQQEVCGVRKKRADNVWLAVEGVY